MTRFTVQSKIVYKVNLFAMSAMQCVIYALEYKVFALVSAATSHCLLLTAMPRIMLSRALH